MIQKINVKGMHCSSCEMLVKDALSDMDGVNNSTASHKDGIVEVDFDENKIELEAIKKAIRNEGYEA